MCKRLLSWLLTIAMVFSLFAVMPITASAVSPITMPIAAGYNTGYTVKSDGTVWAWGCNLHGQLGNGNNTDSNVPVQVRDLTGVTAIAAGNNIGYALSAGTVWAWGNNNEGQLGNGLNIDSNVPVPVSGLTGISAIASRESTGYALKSSDGTVWTWGSNSQGQLGTNDKINRNTPVQVGTLAGASAIACAAYTGYAVIGGEVWAWGAGDQGQIGNNTTWESLLPAKALGLSNVTAVAAGFKTAYALKADGTVWAWGSNDQCALGIGAYNNGDYRSIPLQVPVLNNIVAIAAEEYGGYALDSFGNVWSWGETANANPRNFTPVRVADPSDTTTFLSHVTAISGWFRNAYVLKSDGSVWSWGSNTNGALGNSSTPTATTLVPVQVSGFNPVVTACEIGTTPYSTLGAALNSVTNGQTIKLLQNISYAGSILAADKSFNIDLNTYLLNIIATSAHGIDAENGNTIAVNGTGGLNVTVNNPTGDYAGLYASGAGSKILSGSTVNCTVNSNGESGDGVGVYSGGTVVLTGSVTATGVSSTGVLASGSGSSITVYGTANGANGAYADGSGSITVSGNVTATGVYGTGAVTYSSGTITIGGSLSGVVLGADAFYGGSITVTGDVTATGTYSTGTQAYEGGIIDVGGSVIGGHYGADTYGSGSSITIDGDSTAACGRLEGEYGSAAQADDGSCITIHGSTFVTGSYGYGANAINGSTVTISGNISAPGEECYGAAASGTSAASSVTVDGTIMAETYVRIAGVSKTAADYTAPTTMAGYLTYTDSATPSNTVWVKVSSENGFEEDFEIDPDSRWTGPGTDSARWSFTDTLSNPAASAHGGTHVAMFKSDSAVSGGSAYLTYKKSLDLSNGGRYGLEFWMYYDRMYVATDALTVQVSVNGGINWMDICTYCQSSDSAGWKRNYIDLSTAIQSVSDKSNVSIRFFGTSNWGNNIFIDDVSVYSLCIIGYCPVSLTDGGFTDYTMIDGVKYYNISTASQLAHISQHLDLNYIQTADIDIADEHSAGWTPIGGFGDNTDLPGKFTGVYLGNGHKIENLYFSEPTAQDTAYIGLFAFIYGHNAGVRGLTVTVTGANSNVKYLNFGVIAGMCYGGTIQDCNVTINGDIQVSSVSSNTGGVVGSAYPEWNSAAGTYYSDAIDGCTVSLGFGSILAGGVYDTNGGGIAGRSDMPIMNCDVIIGTNKMIRASTVGGIAGSMYPKIIGILMENCTVTGGGRIVVYAQHNASYILGGLVGRLYEGNIVNSENEVFVDATGVTEICQDAKVYAGGMVGYLGSRSVLTGCKNSGDVSVNVANNILDMYGAPGVSQGNEYAYAGGIAGYVYGYSNAVTIENCENRSNITSNNQIPGLRAYAGGIAGHVDSSDGDHAGVIVKNCANLGADKIVSASAGTTMTGGIFGSTTFHDFETPNIILQNSYNQSAVRGVSNSAPAAKGVCVGITAGGIIGAAGEVTVQNTYSTATNVEATSTYGADAYKGGIFGVIYMTTASLNYYEINTNVKKAVGAKCGADIVAQDDAADSYMGATAAELKTKSFLSGWPWYTEGGTAPDFYNSTNPWRMISADGYPLLKGKPYTVVPITGDFTYTLYTITATAGMGGSISPSGIASVKKYGSISFTITPAKGYKITDVLVDGKSVGKMTEYSFKNVLANHTIKAEFVHDCPSKQFIDVDTGLWYHEGIDYMLFEKLFNGTSAATFEPVTYMTRAMLVTVLYRLEGTPTTVKRNSFSDVADGTWYIDAVNWAFANNIIYGFDADTFEPNEPITREQMASILYRYANYKGYDVTASNNLLAFTDAGNVSKWALPSMKWAVAEGLITGVASTALDPGGKATRAQVAVVIMRFVENIVK